MAAKIFNKMIGIIDTESQNIGSIENCLKLDIYQLFPYSSPKFDSKLTLEELKESCQNLKTRLLNLKKINKSLDSFIENSNQLNWEELQKISKEQLNN